MNRYRWFAQFCHHPMDTLVSPIINTPSPFPLTRRVFLVLSLLTNSYLSLCCITVFVYCGSCHDWDFSCFPILLITCQYILLSNFWSFIFWSKHSIKGIILFNMIRGDVVSIIGPKRTNCLHSYQLSKWCLPPSYYRVPLQQRSHKILPSQADRCTRPTWSLNSLDRVSAKDCMTLLDWISATNFVTFCAWAWMRMC